MCKRCGLVRSDPISPYDFLAQLYQQSAFTYSEEIGNLRKTYGNSLSQLSAYGAHKLSLLEIGCGNGFFFRRSAHTGLLAGARR
jgi:2-polyprenyl-3-methyl-5-hydroxy-6-metoxy-1,4-benzoquinol methylase